MNFDVVSGRIKALNGDVDEAWALLYDADPGFADALSKYLVAAGSPDALPPHITELLLLAHDASLTVLDRDGVRRRIHRAREAGASTAEILDVFRLLCMLSIHSVAEGLPIAVGRSYPAPQDMSGPYWETFESTFPGLHGGMAKATPDFFEAYREMGSAIWQAKGLHPKWRELVWVVADLATNHLFSSGAQLHAANAMRYGATAEEVVSAVLLDVVYVQRTAELMKLALSPSDTER